MVEGFGGLEALMANGHFVGWRFGLGFMRKISLGWGLGDGMVWNMGTAVCARCPYLAMECDTCMGDR